MDLSRNFRQPYRAPALSIELVHTPHGDISTATLETARAIIGQACTRELPRLCYETDLRKIRTDLIAALRGKFGGDASRTR